MLFYGSAMEVEIWLVLKVQKRLYFFQDGRPVFLRERVEDFVEMRLRGDLGRTSFEFCLALLEFFGSHFSGGSGPLTGAFRCASSALSFAFSVRSLVLSLVNCTT